MAKFGKWLGGGLGWAFGGPIGALIGYFIGNYFDKKGDFQHADGRTTKGDFMMSLLVLVAAILKADGKIVRAELDFVKQNFVRSFGEAQAKELIRLLGDLVKQEIPLPAVCRQISQHMDHSSRLELLHLLFAISQADGQISAQELQLLERIARDISISTSDYQSIKGMFVKDTSNAYRILEIEPTASEEEIKKAYRKMAVKYHPDKVAYLGEEIVADAKQKFQKVNEAYELIKKERGFN